VSVIVPAMETSETHNHQLEDRSDDGTERLDVESGPRGKLGVLCGRSGQSIVAHEKGRRLTTELEIPRQSPRLVDRVGAVEGEVQVGASVSGDETRSDDLSERLDVGAESSDGVLQKRGVSTSSKGEKEGRRTTTRTKGKMTAASLQSLVSARRRRIGRRGLT
jgi:hypothetical protein